MNKKGQIALFVIIAVLIIAAVALVFYTQQSMSSKKVAYTPLVIQPLNDFVDSCVEKTAENALVIIGQQGGYYKLPSNSLENYVYYSIGKISYFPKEPEIERQLSFYMNENLPFCINNFIDFPEFQIDANNRNIRTNVTILKNKVRFNVNYEIAAGDTFSENPTTYNLKSFSAEIPSRIDSISLSAGKITAEEVKSKALCLSCLMQVGIDNNIKIYVERFGNDSLIFTLVDENVQIKNQSYEFIFATRD